MSGILTKHKVVYALRKTADKYKGSKRPHDATQGETLENIANAVIGDDIEDALIRYDALHPNIKSHLPFFVLDYFDKAEKHIDL